METQISLYLRASLVNYFLLMHSHVMSPVDHNNLPVAPDLLEDSTAESLDRLMPLRLLSRS